MNFGILAHPLYRILPSSNSGLSTLTYSGFSTSQICVFHLLKFGIFHSLPPAGILDPLKFGIPYPIKVGIFDLNSGISTPLKLGIFHPRFGIPGPLKFEDSRPAKFGFPPPHPPLTHLPLFISFCSCSLTASKHRWTVFGSSGLS